MAETMETLEAQLRFYREREAYFARLLKVADGGQYRADWGGAIERLVRERDEALAAVKPPTDLSRLSTDAIRAETARRNAAWGDRKCCACGSADPGLPCDFPEHARYTCQHPNKKRQGSDPEGDVQYWCPDCRRQWWWP